MTQQPVLGNISPLIPAGADLETTVKFYEKLGFKVVHKEGQPARMAIVKRDAAEIFLVKNDYIFLAESIALRIQVNQLEQYYNELLSIDSKIIHQDGKLETKPWGVKEFVVLDPNGVCVTFYEKSS